MRGDGLFTDADAARASKVELVRLQDTAVEEALFETTTLRKFVGLNLDIIPDETAILNFRKTTAL